MRNWIAVSEIVRNAALAVAAFVGTWLAWRKFAPERTQAESAASQAELARRAHVTELFNRAAGQLADERLEVRLAAIYVLREVGRDFPDLANPVFELLQAHLRQQRTDYGEDEPPIDVRAIIEALRVGSSNMTPTRRERIGPPAVDIQGAFVRRTDLSGASLRGANLSNADASGALFRNADFKDALLVGTILRGADLSGAQNLTEQQLSDAVIDEDTKLPAYIDRGKLLTVARGTSVPTRAEPS